MRFKKILPALMLALAITVAAQQQQPSVEGARAVLVRLAELSKKQELRTETARKLLTGEMSELKTDSFGQLTDAPDKVLLTEKTRAVGRFQLAGASGRVIDVYFYLQYEAAASAGWKVYAVRALALTGIPERAYLALKDRPNLTEDEKRSVANLKIMLAPDRDLRAWFSENRPALDRFRVLLRPKRSMAATLYVGPNDKQFPAAAALLRRLNLSTATLEKNGNLEIVVGGITDNTVGFIYSPSGNPPPISPNLYIWVEAVAEKWFLFRTT